jgi:DNA-binding PadR family transcriptional regulator
VSATLGQNEALILAGLRASEASTIAQVAERIESTREIGDGSIYIALQRMVARGLVRVQKATRRSANDRMRTIGFYTITGAGQSALDAWEHDANRVRQLRATTSPA